MFRPAAPAGQTATAATPGQQPITIQFMPDGSVSGLNAVDQVASAFMRQIVPAIKDGILPIIQRDKELQRTIGEAAGRGAVKALRPYLIVVAGAAAFVAYAYWRSTQRDGRENPSRTRRFSRRAARW